MTPRPSNAWTTTRLMRRTASVATSLVATAVLTAPADAAPAPTRTPVAAPRAAALACRAATPADRPVTFSPKLTLRPRHVNITGTLKLTACTSPNGSQQRLRSATLTMKGSGQASCSGASNITGTATITWRDGAGHRAGTSAITSTRRSISGYNPGDALLGGTVTHGVLTGRRVVGSATPTSDVTSCATRGLATLHAAGKIKFMR